MKSIQKPADDLVPDETRIEELLSNIQPVPGNAFVQKMGNAPWQAEQTQRKIFMKTKFALSAFALLLVLVLTVTLVPPVRAQVLEWYTIVFRDPNNPNLVASSGVEGQPMPYQALNPGYLPKMFSGGATFIAFGDISEMLYQADDKFLLITQQVAKNAETLPQGEPTTVNGQPAALNTGLSGRYQQSSLGELEASGVVTAGEGSQSGTIAGTDPNIAPTLAAFDYTDAARLTFLIGTTRVEILSNLDVEELIKIAESLIPAE